MELKKSVSWDCKKCGKSYKTNKGLIGHKCSVCVDCGQHFPSKYQLKKHKCKLFSSEHKCSNCHKIYKSEVNLKKHKCSFCTKCNIIYSTYQKFSNHMCKKQKNSSENILLEKSKKEKGNCKEDSSNLEQLQSSKNESEENIKSVDEIQDINKEVSITKISETQEFTYNPITVELQKTLSANLSIQNKNIPETFPKRSNVMLGKPVQTSEIISDGNCFFRAISFAITGSQDHHHEIRKKTCEHMIKIERKLSSLINEPIENYLQRTRMMESRVWATQVEIFALAHFLKTNIYVYSLSGHNWTWMKFSGQFIDAHLHTYAGDIYLYHRNLNHYEVVLDFQTMPSAPEKPLLQNYFKFQLTKEKLFQQMTVKEKDQERKRILRLDPNYRAKENEKKRLSLENRYKEKVLKKIKREDNDVRQNENKRKRESQHNRKKECIHKKEIRININQREKENFDKRSSILNRLKEKDHKRNIRMDEELRNKENQAKQSSDYSRKNECDHKEHKRASSEERAKENQAKRSSKTNRNNEREHKITKRNSKEHRDNENEKKRLSNTNRQKEKINKRNKRKDPDYLNKEKKAKKHKKDGNVENMISNFHNAVKIGPLYVCTLCLQTWYRESVKLAISNGKSRTNKTSLMNNIKSFNDQEWICNTCNKYISENKIPPCSKFNKTCFEEKPNELLLTEAEEKLISLRIPFMQLHELPRGKQISLHGNVVNVLTNIKDTVAKLPRKIDENATIPMKLKRKLSYKHHVTYQTLRPEKIISALEWLLENTSQYKEAGIEIDKSWNSNEITEEITIEKEGEHNEDMWNEVPEEELPCGTVDTLLHPLDLTTEGAEVFSFAPAEGNTPLNIFFDKNAEEMSFPTIFCGKNRAENTEREVNVSYGDICKSELRNVDRRVASHIPNIFLSLKSYKQKVFWIK